MTKKISLVTLLLFIGILLAVTPSITAAQDGRAVPNPCVVGGGQSGRYPILRNGITIGTNGSVRPFGCSTAIVPSRQITVRPQQTWNNLYVGIVTVHVQPWNLQGWAESYLNANTTVQFSICANVTQHIIGGVNHGSTGASCTVTASANVKATAGPKNGGSGCFAYNFSGTTKYFDTDTWHTFTDTTGTYQSVSGGTGIYQTYSCS